MYLNVNIHKNDNLSAEQIVEGCTHNLTLFKHYCSLVVECNNGVSSQASWMFVTFL